VLKEIVKKKQVFLLLLQEKKYSALIKASQKSFSVSCMHFFSILLKNILFLFIFHVERIKLQEKKYNALIKALQK